MSLWQTDHVWKFEELNRRWTGVLLIYVWCSNLKRWKGPRVYIRTLGQSTAYMAAYSDFRLVLKVTPQYGDGMATRLPYSRCSYLCRKPTEVGQVSLEWRSIVLTLR